MAGFLGTHLVTQLLAGHLCTPRSSLDSALTILPLNRIELVHADIRDEPAVHYHLAADPHL